MEDITYDKLSLAQTSLLYCIVGCIGLFFHGLVILSYFYVKNIKGQHPTANIIIWHIGCSFMTYLGFVITYFLHMNEKETPIDWQCNAMAIYNQFFFMASNCWYLMLTVDLLVALVNPWMGYSCMGWVYHFFVWTFSASSAGILSQFSLTGLSSLNLCWIRRTEDIEFINIAQWILMFSPVIFIAGATLLVLLFASFRFVRRQLDVTYRTKRRLLLQYYRYLLIYAGCYGSVGMLYYTLYRQNISHPTKTTKHMELVFIFSLGIYPFLMAIVWSVNTEIYQNRPNHAHSLASRSGLNTQSAGMVESGEHTSLLYPQQREDVVDIHFSTVIRKDLMRYTTAGIRCSLMENTLTLRGSLVGRPRSASLEQALASSFAFFTTKVGTSPQYRSAGETKAAVSDFLEQDADSVYDEQETDSKRDLDLHLYHEKKRLATTIYNGEFRYYEKLGFTDYAPQIFRDLREAMGLSEVMYESSFAGVSGLLERASEGKSGQLFYFTRDNKYLVKTLTKREHSFLLKILPLYHNYILQEPNSLLCRFLGCHSMQLPVGWNKIFFVVMQNIFKDGPPEERYDLKGIFQASVNTSNRPRDISNPGPSPNLSSFTDCESSHAREEAPGKLKVRKRAASLRHDKEFVIGRVSLSVDSTTRANLLAQVTKDCGFLQELGIMDYSCLLGIRHEDAPSSDMLAWNSVISNDGKTIYSLGFIDILQSYNFGWKCQHWFLSTFKLQDTRVMTAVPPAEYALRFLRFMHTYLLSETSNQ